MRRALMCAGWLLAVPMTGLAQELTIDELVSLAVERAPSLQAARTEIDAAQGQVAQAALRPNPMIGSSRREMVGGDEYETMVEVQWPLDLFRRSARVAAARQELAVMSSSVADRERVLAAAVREQAGRVLEARRTLDVLAELLNVDRQMRDLAEARVVQGSSPRLDLDILQVEVQRVEAQEALMAGELEAELIALRELVGLPPDAAATVAGSLEEVVRTLSAGEPRLGSQAAVDGRADVRESVARVSLAEARLEEVQRDSRIDASIVGAYSRMTAGFPQRAFDAGGALVPIRGLFNNVRVGVIVSVPIRDRRQGLIAAAVADRRRAAHEVAAARLAAGAEIAAAGVRERAARRAVELYATGAREQARRNVEVVREAYQLGSATLVDVLDEQRRYLDVEAAYTQALAGAYQARTALRRATGEVR